MTLKEQILAADDLKREPLDIPEWGLTVYVRTMSGAERDNFEQFMQGQAKQHIRARLAVLTLCDKDGKPQFDDGDIAALSDKSSVALDRIMTTALRVNAMTNGEFEEMEKN